MYRYKAQILRWIDGDTVTVDVDLGFRIHLEMVVRIYGINAPEMRSSDKVVKKAGEMSRHHALVLAPPGTILEIVSHKPSDPMEKYGRWLASMWLPNGKDFATEMIAAGHAVSYIPE